MPGICWTKRLGQIGLGAVFRLVLGPDIFAPEHRQYGGAFGLVAGNAIVAGMAVDDTPKPKLFVHLVLKPDGIFLVW